MRIDMFPTVDISLARCAESFSKLNESGGSSGGGGYEVSGMLLCATADCISSFAIFQYHFPTSSCQSIFLNFCHCVTPALIAGPIPIPGAHLHHFDVPFSLVFISSVPFVDFATLHIYYIFVGLRIVASTTALLLLLLPLLRCFISFFIVATVFYSLLLSSGLPCADKT